MEEGLFFIMDRQDAGNMLAEKLADYAGVNAVICALPPGGVILGTEIAEKLKLPLDVIVVEKVNHPDYHGYAVCAVSEEGDLSCSESEKLGLALNSERLKREIKNKEAEALKRRYLYTGNKKHISIERKTAIIVDDGIVTGLTMLAAIHYLKRKKPKEIIVAVPIASRNVIGKIEKEVSRVVILKDTKGYFNSMNEYYKDFPKLSDADTIATLRARNK